MDSYNYISLTILRPDKIVGHTWDGIVPETIRENIIIEDLSPFAITKKIEKFLIQENYLYENFNYLSIKNSPLDNKVLYIEIPGEEALDEYGRMHNCFAVFSIQSGLYDQNGHYAAGITSETAVPITIWNEK